MEKKLVKVILQAILSKNSLEQPTIFQIIFDYDVSDSIKDKLNVVCVGGACEMRVDLFLVFSLVQILKLHSNVTRGFLVSV